MMFIDISYLVLIQMLITRVAGEIAYIHQHPQKDAVRGFESTNIDDSLITNGAKYFEDFFDNKLTPENVFKNLFELNTFSSTPLQQCLDTTDNCAKSLCEIFLVANVDPKKHKLPNWALKSKSSILIFEQE